jgi:hypothetical protein
MQTVIAVRAEGSRPPLFAVHGAGGWNGTFGGSSATSTMISRSTRFRIRYVVNGESREESVEQ